MANGTRTLKDIAAARGMSDHDLVVQALREAGNPNAAAALLGVNRASIIHVMYRDGIELRVSVIERKHA